MSVAPKLAYTIAEAAIRTSIPEADLLQSIDDGDLPCFDTGSGLRVAEDALERHVMFLEANAFYEKLHRHVGRGHNILPFARPERIEFVFLPSKPRG